MAEQKRSSGILLAVSSLPSRYGIGTLGKKAYEFIDFLHASGQKYWQVLPIGPTGYCDSPYQTFCSSACNPYFIDLDMLLEEGLLKDRDYTNKEWSSVPDHVDYGHQYELRSKVLKKAYNRFDVTSKDFISFCNSNVYWLNDYAIFMSLKTYYGGKEWQTWDEDIRMRKQSALEHYGTMLCDDILFHKFMQYEFLKQWKAMRSYANSQGVEIIGDIPIYAASDSSDVWSRPHLFLTDSDRKLTAIAGVPPDAFSATGQLWGNPLYNWSEMEKEDFYWWKQRIHIASVLFDVVRIDHFIGIARYFVVPADATSAVLGEYAKGPGMKLINAINDARGSLRIIAEDLGILIDEVRDLLNSSGYPGMKVLQFGFAGGPGNDNLPMHYLRNIVAYTATHDNDTTVNYLRTASKEEKTAMRKYIGKKRVTVNDFISEIMKSVADTVVIPMQDHLELGNDARMNHPSVTFGNWTWRLKEDQLTKELSEKILDMTEFYDRKA